MMESPQSTAPPSYTKKDRFRAQIRRSSLLSRLEEQRRQVRCNIELENLTIIVKRIEKEGNLNQEEINDVLNILDNNCQNAAFNFSIGRERLEQGLASLLILNWELLRLQERNSVLSALNFLTYYHDQSSDTLTTHQQFSDFLRKVIDKMTLQEIQELETLQQVITLLMNLSSIQKKDYNLYLAQSDICQRILYKIEHTNNLSKCRNHSYKQTCSQLRNRTLRMLKNVIAALEKDHLPLVLRLITAVLQDQLYFQQQPACMLFLLAESMKKEEFWPQILEKEEQKLISQAVTAIDIIQERCLSPDFLKDNENSLTQQEQHQFTAVLHFLNQLYYQNQLDLRSNLTWQIAVENLLNGYMLAEYLFSSYKQLVKQKKDKKSNVSTALKTFSLLSESEFVTADQLIIVRPSEDQYALIKFWMDKSLLTGPDFSLYCLTILKNLLKKDNKYFHILMELQILDPLGDVLEKDCNEHIKEAAIQMAQVLMTCDETETSRMIEILEHKGITKQIENLLNHPIRAVFQKAELFNEQFAILYNKKKESC